MPTEHLGVTTESQNSPRDAPAKPSSTQCHSPSCPVMFLLLLKRAWFPQGYVWQSGGHHVRLGGKIHDPIFPLLLPTHVDTHTNQFKEVP